MHIEETGSRLQGKGSNYFFGWNSIKQNQDKSMKYGERGQEK